MILSNTQNKPKRHIKGGWVNPSSLPKNKDGMTQCRWCSGSVLPPRRTFCSDECVHQHRLRTNSTYLRTCVYKRDNGICAICHQDTKLIARQAKKYKANKEWKSFYKLLDDNNIHHTYAQLIDTRTFVLLERLTIVHYRFYQLNFCHLSLHMTVLTS